MDASTTASVVSAGAAIAAAGFAFVALPFTVRAANASHRQTELQREIAEQAAQPYVWADVRMDEAQGWNLNFVVGNSGPSVATEVVITVNPPLPVKTHDAALTTRAFDRLRDGIQALPPGRIIEWSLGGSPDIVGDGEPRRFTITVDGCGPHGPLPRLTYVIDLADFRESNDSPPGSLYQLTQAVEAVGKKL